MNVVTYIITDFLMNLASTLNFLIIQTRI